jgi:dolichol-phosphate mannosyltransferase
MGTSQRCLVSFVVPLFNEERSVRELYERVSSAALLTGGSFELVCIDDDSNDDTLKILKALCAADPRVKVVSFSRNFGHQLAVTAGLRYASGEYVLVMDGDLQDPPELIGPMLAKAKEGFDVVYGIRRNRKESIFKRLCYRAFYRILQAISPLSIPLDAGDFCLMSRRVVLEMRRINEGRPFVRGLRAWVGFRQTGVKYDRNARTKGDSKYNLMRLFSLAFDGTLSFSVNALRVAVFMGMLVAFASMGYAVYIGVNRILIALGYVHSAHLIPGWATLVCSVMFFIGLQFIFLGILGEYVGRIFMEVKDRPLFVVKEEMGFGDDR